MNPSEHSPAPESDESGRLVSRTRPSPPAADLSLHESDRPMNMEHQLDAPLKPGARSYSADFELECHMQAEVARLDPHARKTLEKNLTTMKGAIEAFCEAAATQLTAILVDVEQRNPIRLRDLSDCWLTSWEVVRVLRDTFENEMESFRRIDQNVNLFCGYLLDSVRTVVEDLSDLSSVYLNEPNDPERNKTRATLRTIREDLVRVLSADVETITPFIETGLMLLRTTTQDPNTPAAA